jgi:hypothetical protein
MVSVDYLNRRSFAKVTDQGGYGKAGLTADLARIAAVAYASLLYKRRSSTDSRLHREMSGRSSGRAGGAGGRQLVGRPAACHPDIPRVVRRISTPILRPQSLSRSFSTGRPVVRRRSRGNVPVSVRVPGRGKGGRLAIAMPARQFGGEKSRFVGRSSQPSFERRDAAAPRLHNLRRLSGHKLVLNGAHERLGFLKAQTDVAGRPGPDRWLGRAARLISFPHPRTRPTQAFASASPSGDVNYSEICAYPTGLNGSHSHQPQLS